MLQNSSEIPIPLSLNPVRLYLYKYIGLGGIMEHAFRSTTSLELEALQVEAWGMVDYQ